jgi:NADH:ubiquinone oxidoreductase subunit E
MNKIIDVEICTGTTCFVMGAGHLMNLAEDLPFRLKGVVNIRGSHCLGLCGQPENGTPPFATVNGAIMANVTAENLIAACDLLLSDGEGVDNEPV